MLNKLYNLSIKTKFTITIFFIILFFSTGIIFIIKGSLSSKVNKLASNTAKDLIKVNEAFFTKSLLEDDSWSIYKFLNSLTNISLIKSAGFVDNSNKIIAHTNTKLYPMDKIVEIKKNEDILLIPLISGQIKLGVFIIELDKNSLTTSFNNLKSYLIFYILFATLFSFIVAFLISKQILKRLKILSHNAIMIQNKKYDEIKSINSKENDEITLFHNSMELILKKLSDSVENEKSLKKFYHNILENIDELVILCDNDFQLLYKNFHKLTNLIVQNNQIDLIVLKNIKKNVYKNINNFIIEIINKNGKSIYLYVLVKKLDNSMAISFSDITLLKQLQEKQCLTNSFEIVGEISVSVVHEIKNYLLPAKLLIEQDEIDNEDKHRIINIISKIDHLVNDFLRAGRPIDKQLSVDLDVQKELELTISLIQKQILDKNLNIEQNYSKNLKIFIAKQDFQTIVLNLLENAIDESKENGTIILNLFMKNHHAVIEIIDFGRGIDKNILKDIYKPFFTTKGEKGTGIGLYTTYKIVYLYNGFIEVTSNVGKTIFSINIPLKDENEYSNN